MEHALITWADCVLLGPADRMLSQDEFQSRQVIITALGRAVLEGREDWGHRGRDRLLVWRRTPDDLRTLALESVDRSVGVQGTMRNVAWRGAPTF